MRVIVNDGEEVEVDPGTHDNYYIDEVSLVKDSVIRCGQCKKVAVHNGIQVTLGSDEDTVAFRYYLCTNCGKFLKR